MHKKKLSPTDLFVIAANLLPVVGVWCLGWSATEAFIVYALETIIVGLIALLKMLCVTVSKKRDDWHANGKTTSQSGLFFILFFIIHFGFFLLVQTTLFSQAAGITPTGSGMFYFITHLDQYIDKEVGYMLIAFSISHSIKSLFPFLLRQEYKTQSLMLIMFQPYGRIFIQQFTVILGSMLLTFGLGGIFIIVFAAAKIFMEVFFNYDRLLNKAMVDMKKESSEQ
jgi:Family of unknown function (DUF6498)